MFDLCQAASFWWAGSAPPGPRFLHIIWHRAQVRGRIIFPQWGDRQGFIEAWPPRPSHCEAQWEARAGQHKLRPSNPLPTSPSTACLQPTPDVQQYNLKVSLTLMKHPGTHRMRGVRVPSSCKVESPGFTDGSTMSRTCTHSTQQAHKHGSTIRASQVIECQRAALH
jgi:hypothetical protein